ncbi:Hypothetical predicted protein [Paramuricea clavata]|uniref:DDE Tnp4 domain-containing protein n=1 Tax=Paramuricea clavata TaxID=317549 RepID=A0A7D9KAW1_PARCT|nr:Hypothetical predicted protein [Paramuricea clavata]
MMHRFGRSVPELSLIASEVTDFMFENHGHLLRTFYQQWLEPDCLVEFANAIHIHGAALTNCWGFVDGTVRPIARPNQHQRTVYNGHKRVHAIKFQSVVAPNGLIANLYGPVEGKRQTDAGMLRMSGLLESLETHCNTAAGEPL